MSWNVLVVDDDPAICATLEYILKRVGHRVRTTASAPEAYVLAQQDRYDLMICDLVMPLEDGVRLIRRCKTTFPEMRILAISGGATLGTPDTLTSARQAGADAVLAKPFAPIDLRSIVATVLEGSVSQTPDI